MPRPRPRHANVVGRLRRRLGAFDDPDKGEPGGWLIFPGPELSLSESDKPVVPDLAGWRVDSEVEIPAAPASSPGTELAEASWKVEQE
jgi:hypothetical protein